MTMRVLPTKREIGEARSDLVRRRLSHLDGRIASKVKGLLRRVGMLGSPVVGDNIKSWDVLQTLNFIEEHLNKDAKILDVGCYASEILLTLHNAGFTDLSGIDLNPYLSRMPRANVINYVVGDFMDTRFPDASFDVLTSISVIEHGFDGEKLLAEMSRILRPGGYFLASFDYWPEKIDTTSTKFFDMTWLIFSEQDAASLIDKAARHQLYPVGELRYEAHEKAIEHGGYAYTFGWIALQKKL